MGRSRAGNPSRDTGIFMEPTIQAPLSAAFALEKFEWPQAQEALRSLQGQKPYTLIHGVPGSAKAFLLAWLHQKLQESHPWLIVTPTRDEALALQDDLFT